MKHKRIKDLEEIEVTKKTKILVTLFEVILEEGDKPIPGDNRLLADVRIKHGKYDFPTQIEVAEFLLKHFKK